MCQVCGVDNMLSVQALAMEILPDHGILLCRLAPCVVFVELISVVGVVVVVAAND